MEQARGDERPIIDLPDDLLLAGVALHDVLAARVGPGRGLALGGGVPVAFAGVALQPAPETLGGCDADDVARPAADRRSAARTSEDVNLRK